MGTSNLLRTVAVIAVAAAAALAPLPPASAADPQAGSTITVAAADSTSRAVSLGVGKSVAIDLPADVKDVLVADPKIANAVVRSTQRAYIIGAAVGQTNIVFFDSAGQQIAAYDIAVTRELNGIRAALKQAIPNGVIQVEGLGEGVMLTGSVATAIEAQQATDLATRLTGSPDKVVNSIAVRGRDQACQAGGRRRLRAAS